MKQVMLLLAFLILAISNASAQEGNPTLKETVEWLQSKAHLINSVSAKSLRGGVEAKEGSEWELTFKDPCTIELKSRGGKAPRSSVDNPRIMLYPPPPADPSTVTIPLSSLNPQRSDPGPLRRVSFTADTTEIGTTDGKEVLIWQGADKTFNANSLTINFKGSIFDSKDSGLARRASKAFQHAIVLCGGRPDKKEPF